MSPRPYVLLSAAMSLDGHLDTAEGPRLVLSSDEDWDRVDEVRAGCDAILVGAATIRSDNPRLRVRSAARRRERTERGLPPDPVKVTLTATGDLDPAGQFFTAGDAQRLVYAPASAVDRARDRLGEVATVVEGEDLTGVLADLAARGVRRLMVEGGGTVHTQFLAADLADELHLVVAPFLLGSAGGARFTGPAEFPQSPRRPMRLAGVEPIGDLVLMRYTVGG
ncbi:RibD family protein [Amycolatopsis suaedae]|uniref:Deaminase n=1 Tax=Amycolatopsis suaedae TaxID=2510978 RepID=A0A4Q7J0C5_9PSEU|nr:deaminase [Amycolatopsis suaedae]